MSHFFNAPIYYYEPTLLGHPHEQAEPTATEPFWQQYPPWAQPDQHINNYYNQPPFFRPFTMSHAMDSAPVIIGKNTNNGRKVTNPANNRGPNPNRPIGKVEIFSNGKHVGTMPLGPLTRFSKLAAETFPKPTAPKDTANEGSKVTKGDNEEAQDAGAEQLAADVGKLEINNEAKGKGKEVNEKVESDDRSSTKRLDIYLDTLYIQPTQRGFDFAFGWMHEAKHTERFQAPVQYGVPHPENLTLAKLIDIYAAGLALNVRPPPLAAKDALMTRVSNISPKIEDVQYVCEHLPIADPVVTRLINSYFNHKFSRHADYTPEEIEEIEVYFTTVDEALFNRYDEVDKHRRMVGAEKRRKLRERDAGHNLQQLAQGGEGPAPVNQGRAPAQQPAPTPAEANAGTNASGQANPKGSRRNPRKAEKGKGIGGRYVPGA
ncbi:hypothetical protein LTR37_009803 [Vermiconidia calcicola]|uniref:Uncharacterized protein n=1 Tax=Vermiconidia calcicola TaxID=1690605 RepID=A0ACC3N6S3_9PEZI|nr:hypothetical protein LTR37_009803 [Vermiconidia calcicola]